MIQEILQAGLDPFTKWQTWYGVMAGLAFRRQFRKLIYGGFRLARGSAGTVKQKVAKDGR